jgi:NTE family protein
MSLRLTANAPVTFIEPDETAPGPEQGIALCLSGGGYRAMLFHLGAILRLNEAKLLEKLARISSVSGGSITAGRLGIVWKALKFADGVATNLVEQLVDPVRALASRTIDVPSIILGLLSSSTIGDRIAATYDKHLFHGATLQGLPSDGDGPRFVINATNVQTGSLWRFSKPYMADYLVGRVMNPTLRVSVAVAASSAFPPVLSPVILRIEHAAFSPEPGYELKHPPYTTRVVLSDGGVYDNLGLETAWKRYTTIMASDGGGKLGPEARPRRNWLSHSRRIINVVDEQVRKLRKRQLMESYQTSQGDFARTGAYWGIRTDIRNYGLADALPCPEARTLLLADIPTRLKRLDAIIQERLINWGYSVCDAALRKHVDELLPRPSGFPYPAAGV